MTTFIRTHGGPVASMFDGHLHQDAWRGAGSGKTLAYLIPLVMSLTRRRYQSRVAAKAAAAAAAEDQPGTKRTALNGKRGTAGDSAAQSVTEAPVGPQVCSIPDGECITALKAGAP